jgi:hypothetical protein
MPIPAVLFLVLLLAACATPDAQVPPFAKQPYAPFSRSAAIAIAEREWRLFGAPVDDGPAKTEPIAAYDRQPDKPERAQGLWQRVGEYWWLGLNNGAVEGRWTGKHDAAGHVFPAADDGEYAWSAAFISYVMRMAGAGQGFHYSAAHSTYIDQAARDAAAHRAALVWAEDPAGYAPVPGDLICLGRAADRAMTFADLPAGPFASHCDLVVGAAPGELTVIGGNVDDAVTLKHVPVTGDGLLMGPDGTPVDQRYDWFVVLNVHYQTE